MIHYTCYSIQLGQYFPDMDRSREYLKKLGIINSSGPTDLSEITHMVTLGRFSPGYADLEIWSHWFKQLGYSVEKISALYVDRERILNDPLWTYSNTELKYLERKTIIQVPRKVIIDQDGDCNLLLFDYRPLDEQEKSNGYRNDRKRNNVT